MAMVDEEKIESFDRKAKRRIYYPKQPLPIEMIGCIS
jgi:hypothetical protein